MSNKLELLALNHIFKMSKELSGNCNRVISNNMDKEIKSIHDIHDQIFNLSADAIEIGRWVEAILENKK